MVPLGHHFAHFLALIFGSIFGGFPRFSTSQNTPGGGGDLGGIWGPVNKYYRSKSASLQKLVSLSANQPISKSANRRISQSAHQPASRPANNPTTKFGFRVHGCEACERVSRLATCFLCFVTDRTPQNDFFNQVLAPELITN